MGQPLGSLKSLRKADLQQPPYLKRETLVVK